MVRKEYRSDLPDILRLALYTLEYGIITIKKNGGIPNVTSKYIKDIISNTYCI